MKSKKAKKEKRSSSKTKSKSGIVKLQIKELKKIRGTGAIGNACGAGEACCYGASTDNSIATSQD